MTCDILIPTYNSAQVLPATLAALASQILPSGWDIHLIISDDGSSDATLTVVTKQSLPRPWRLTVVTGPHTGPGGARSRALAHLTGEIILLLGADILLRPKVLAQHLTFHTKHSAPLTAALGMVRWDPRLPPTPLMEWMTHGGQQNDFDSLLGLPIADPAHFWYGSHLSLKGDLLRRIHFLDTFHEYGWEDLSLGRQLEKQGVRLHVLPHALALHHHVYSLAAIARRQQKVGQSLRLYQNLYPDVAQPLRRSLMNHLRRALWVGLGGQVLLSAWLKIFEKTFSFPRLFLVYTSVEFWRGVWRSHGGLLAFLSQVNTIFPDKP